MLETSLKTKIMNEVDRQFDDQTKVLADLVKIPSTRFREAPAQDMMARLFKEDGLGVDRWQIKIDDLKLAEQLGYKDQPTGVVVVFHGRHVHCG